MSEASNYLENKVVDHTLGTAAFTMPSAIYIALFESDPTDAGSGTECTYTNYVRQAITFAASSGGAAASNAEVTFAAIVGADVTVTHFAIYDASTSGNLLYHSPVDASKVYAAADVPSMASGAVTFTLD